MTMDNYQDIGQLLRKAGARSGGWIWTRWRSSCISACVISMRSNAAG